MYSLYNPVDLSSINYPLQSFIATKVQQRLIRPFSVSFKSIAEKQEVRGGSRRRDPSDFVSKLRHTRPASFSRISFAAALFSRSPSMHLTVRQQFTRLGTTDEKRLFEADVFPGLETLPLRCRPALVIPITRQQCFSWACSTRALLRS